MVLVTSIVWYHPTASNCLSKAMSFTSSTQRPNFSPTCWRNCITLRSMPGCFGKSVQHSKIAKIAIDFDWQNLTTSIFVKFVAIGTSWYYFWLCICSSFTLVDGKRILIANWVAAKIQSQNHRSRCCSHPQCFDLIEFIGSLFLQWWTFYFALWFQDPT